MIAHEVAKTRAHEAPKCACVARSKKISVHLFKLRFVSHIFCRTATSVFLALVRRQDFSEYKTLYLPSTSMNLEDLTKTLAGKDKTIANIITKVVFQITTARNEDIDTDYLSDYFGDVLHGHHDGVCVRVSAANVHELIDRNVSLFEKHCSADAAFANDICLPKGIRNIRTLFAGLRKVKTVRFEVDDFWDETFDNFSSLTVQHEAVGLTAYRESVPTILEHLSKSGATDLQLIGFGSHAWAGLDPIRMMKLGRSRNFLGNITHFELNVSRRDDLDMQEWMQEPEHGLMRRGDRVRMLLSYLKKLKSLVIIGEVSNSERSDTDWLEDVLQGQTWPHLRSFTLKSVYVRPATLSSFFRLHQGLEVVVFGLLFLITAAHWYDLLEALRTQMELSSASTMIRRDLLTGHARMAQIMSEHDKDPKDLLWVDVGAYVVKGPVKIEELE